MRLKAGVKISGLQPEILFGIIIIKEVFRDYGLEFTLTSVTDGKHMVSSRHYIGQAADVRSRDIPEELIPQLLKTMKERLGECFDIVFEGDHFHLEYDPD